jgi:ubiquinol-cytochrome c reductase iron-sulfur subunit
VGTSGFFAVAGLRLHRKGANKTAPLALSCFALGGCNRPVRLPRDFSLGGLKPRMDLDIQPGERGPDVTTVSSAEHTRRDFLYISTAAVGAVGAAAALVPLISQMNPDASTIAAGAPIEVDLGPIAEGQMIKVFWRSKPVFIFNRSPKEIEEARKVNVASLPDPETDQKRVKEGHDKWLVVIGICTHLGCIPLANSGPYNGWFCPCHGSAYDTSGRIRQGPAPKNLELPPYTFVSDSKIQIG